jgi:hypothetical protein
MAVEQAVPLRTFPLAISAGLSVPNRSRKWLLNKPFLVSERKLENVARVLARAAAEELDSSKMPFFRR